MKCEQYEFELNKEMIIVSSENMKSLEIPVDGLLAVRTVDGFQRVADLYIHLSETKSELKIDFYLCMTKFLNNEFTTNIVDWPNTFAFLLFKPLNDQARSGSENLQPKDEFESFEVTDDIEAALQDIEESQENKSSYLHLYVEMAYKLLKENNIVR